MVLADDHIQRVVYMMSSKLLAAVLVVALVASLFVLAGCPKKPVAEPTAAPTPMANEGPGAQPVTSAAEPAAAPAEFKWTETPKVADIPAGEIKGMVNGKAFTAKTVRIKQGDKAPVLVISDATVDTPTGVITGDTGVELTFALEPGKPGDWTIDLPTKKTFEKEHAYYYYPQGGDKGPMSVNPDWAAALSITEWNSEKDPKDEAVLGKVKGKVAIVLKDDSKSWVAGEFEGVYYK